MASVMWAMLLTPAYEHAKHQLAQVLISAAPFQLPHEVSDGGIAKRFLQQIPVEAMSETLFHRANVDDIREHMRDSAKAEHPECGWGVCDGSDPSLEGAIAQLCEWGADTAAIRQHKDDVLDAVFASLSELSASIRGQCSPPHLRDSGLNVAAIAACCEVLGHDIGFAVDCALGFMPVGPLDETGAFPLAPPLPACSCAVHGRGCKRHTTIGGKRVELPLDLDTEDHSEWNAQCANELRAEAESGSAEWAEDAASVFAATQQEVEDGLMEGFYSADDLDGLFPDGWRCMKRFGVWQKGKCRCCDDACRSLHNAGTVVPEKVSCVAADFPARAAGLFACYAGFDGPACILEGGSDDIASAYRRIVCAMPQFTVVALWHPERGEVVYCTMRGFNFGLTSAVHAFNRYPRLLTELMRSVHAWSGCSYYDDFCTIEPRWAGGSGQRSLWRMAARFGIPFAAKKHVPMASSVTFLGVEALLGSFWPHGVVTLGVTDERSWRIADSVEYALSTQSLFPGESAKLTGRLGFATQWSSGRFGRAVMQPLYRRAAASNGQSWINDAIFHALTFFAGVLRRGSLPPRKYRFRGRERPTVKVWTDAAWEPDEAVPAMVAYVVWFPGEWGNDATGAEAWLEPYYVHGFAPVPEDVMARLMRRKQYIGQLELLAAIGVYYSIPELRGRRVVHWIDNTSAIAALIKGYSGSPDSVCILHAFAAFSLALEISSWFLWVPSKANIADEPSRGEFALLRELGSTERPFVSPPFAAWDQPAAAWMDDAVARGGSPPTVAARAGRCGVGHARFARGRDGETRVDRKSGSPLGNPIRIGKGVTRAQACEAAAAILRAPRDDDGAPHRIARSMRLPADSVCGECTEPGSQAARLDALDAVATRLAQGRDVHLLCWCYPRQCHADGIRRAAIERAEARVARVKRRR